MHFASSLVGLDSRRGFYSCSVAPSCLVQRLMHAPHAAHWVFRARQEFSSLCFLAISYCSHLVACSLGSIDEI